MIIDLKNEQLMRSLVWTIERERGRVNEKDGEMWIKKQKESNHTNASIGII